MTELAKVVGEDTEYVWLSLTYLKVFYKDNEPYGVIGVRTDDNMAMIYSMAKDDGKFTVGMLRTIIGMYKKLDVTLITDSPKAFGYIREALTRYGFEFFHIHSDTGHEFMYSLHYKGD